MDKRYIFSLILISFLLCNVVAYLDEGIHTFYYLTQGGDWSALIIYTALFTVLPITIYSFIKGSFKKRFLFSIIGFAPILLLIFTLL